MVSILHQHGDVFFLRYRTIKCFHGHQISGTPLRMVDFCSRASGSIELQHSLGCALCFMSLWPLYHLQIYVKCVFGHSTSHHYAYVIKTFQIFLNIEQYTTKMEWMVLQATFMHNSSLRLNGPNKRRGMNK